MKNRYQIDWEAYASCARQAAADGAVLLRNENHALPITSGKVAVFGRSQFNYYKSGTGSGGAVNTRTVKNIIDVLTDEQDLEVNEQVLSAYRTWLAGHPFEKGTGWASEPWSQEEMPLSAEFVKEAHRTSEIAIIIIGRTAGEDMDNTITKGSFLLTDTEEEMLRLVCAEFTCTIVVLNVGNIIDMKWVKAYQPSAVLYTWQGGQEGAAAVGDVLTGRVNPSGKLTDTIAYDIKDYPSTDDFGGETEDLYREDIYVGYRYFETFAKKAVLYPFGYGLSYTTFEITSNQTHYEKGHLSVMAMVRNTGNRAGREVVQVYVEAPQGKLGKPARVLVGFAKTPLIEPGKEALVSIEAGDERFASYDDSGVTGFKSCFLLEEGRYHVYVGSDVRSAAVTYRFELPELKIVDTCKEALAPVQRFTRLKPVDTGDVDYQSRQESVPIRTIDLQARIAAEKLPQGTYAGDASGAAAATDAGSANGVAAATDAGANVAAGVHTLREVLDREITMQTFLSQLTDQDLCCIVRGEGMSSPKVTPGTAAAFGGVTER
nr:glycoside hydrolase family 3 C-terminal domain-containing protein [Lachnospiraceae bacterium]